MSRHQQKIIERYYEHKETINANRLAELVSDLYLAESPQSAAKLWSRAAAALTSAGIDDRRIHTIVNQRDIQALATLAGELAAGKVKPAETPKPAPAAAPAPTPADDPTAPEVLKAAYRAFKKRLKLNQLDEESRLGRSPLSPGQRPRIVAIQPPRDYPQATWDELVRQGRLKQSGRGFYELGN